MTSPPTIPARRQGTVRRPREDRRRSLSAALLAPANSTYYPREPTREKGGFSRAIRGGGDTLHEL